MSAKASKKVVYAAITGNALIAVTKFGAAAYTGSSAMLSEAIHSAVDTGNQGLLLFGMRRAERPADEHHPFGYGKEIYFWSFVVAILLFSMGAGVSFYEGVQKLLHPHPISNPYVNYVVLATAMLFEGAAWWIAFKAFNRWRGDLDFITAVRRSKDPALLTVLVEDSAAILGLESEATGELRTHTGGRPAKLFRFRREALLERPAPGVHVKAGAFHQASEILLVQMRAENGLDGFLQLKQSEHGRHQLKHDGAIFDLAPEPAHGGCQYAPMVEGHGLA